MLDDEYDSFAEQALQQMRHLRHDIGKLERPQYFVENQAKGRNPHDKLKPSASAAIIRNHVREGLELADEIHLPKVLRAFITDELGAAAQIKANPNRTMRPHIDWRLYRERHQVECFFNKLKRFRRTALRCEKTLPAFMGFVHLACAMIWLR